ncbi:MAG: hypothetical protein ACRCZQ_03590, partial [Bacteroidales bacterium]
NVNILMAILYSDNLSLRIKGEVKDKHRNLIRDFYNDHQSSKQLNELVKTLEYNSSEVISELVIPFKEIFELLENRKE